MRNLPEVKDIKELISFFETRQLPKTVKLSEHETITDMEKFVLSHVESMMLHYKKGKDIKNHDTDIFYVYFDKLVEAKNIIQKSLVE